jgi:hypothetical protein
MLLLLGGKNRLKAERAWFLSKRERRAKPETEHFLPRWGKRCAFLNPKAVAKGANLAVSIAFSSLQN